MAANPKSQSFASPFLVRRMFSGFSKREKYLDVSVHDFFAMKIQDSLTDVTKILFNLRFAQWTCFYLLKQSPVVGVFQNHVSYLPFLIDLIVEKLDNFGMGEFVMENDFIFGKFIDLR